MTIDAAGVLGELRDQGVTDVVGLPDNTSAALFTLLAAGGPVRLRTVTREGEAFALAAGLWIGGGRPVVLIQNTGLLESGDGLRGTAVRMGIPLVCLVTYRGYAKMIDRLGAAPQAPDSVLLTRPDLDSTALVTEPTLRAWGIPFDHLHADQDLPRLREAFRRCDEEGRPVAVLVTRDMA